MQLCGIIDRVAKKTRKQGGEKTTIAIDAEIHKQLRILAAHRGVRLNEIVSDAIREYLARHPPE
ncbi:MAG: hypothetical protein AAB403_16725 [Planctomycetota bacterium]